MKAIEERAEKYGIESANLLCSDGWSEEQRQKQAKVYAMVYSKIATEQKVIDDAERDTAVYNLLTLKLDAEKKLWLYKACEWLENNLGYYNRNEVHIGKSYEQCVTDDFRKAMEAE